MATLDDKTGQPQFEIRLQSVLKIAFFSPLFEGGRFLRMPPNDISGCGTLDTEK